MSSYGKSGSVSVVYDALHGNIDLSDFHDETSGQIEKIASAPFMKRLRRIKQLGFVSQNFLSAQHNRYAHALGTAHIMRQLIVQVEKCDHDFFERTLPALHDLTGDTKFAVAKRGRNGNAVSYLKQHLLVAALVQDVGELPYESATASFFSPGNVIRKTVKDTGIAIAKATPKQQFTLYFILERQNWHYYFENLNKTLLTYLISGLTPDGKFNTPETRSLRQMLDGSGIDADRIDYVYRDAFHTIGVHHTPDAIIEAIHSYDAKGTIISHIRPAIDFVVTRAMLWSNVYLSPENRFWLVLLKRALQELHDKKPDLFSEYFRLGPGEITPEDFLNLDDVLVDNVIRQICREKPDIDRDPAQLLDAGAVGYDYRWVELSKKPDDEWSGDIHLPHDFYWDTYADYRARKHSLHEAGSIRIRGDRYSLLDDEVGLERCIGPFSTMLEQDTLPPFPMPNHMAWFARSNSWNSTEENWRRLMKFKEASQLSGQLQLTDPIGGIRITPDTRDMDGFHGPDIFLAFSWQDKEQVERLARILFVERRRYWVLTDGRVGIGATTHEISRKAVNAAGAIILLASKSYVTSYNDRPNDGIHGEVSAMEGRKSEIPIVPMALDDSRELQDMPGFPWRSITSQHSPPFMGSDLRHMSLDDFHDRVREVLQFIDESVGPVKVT